MAGVPHDDFSDTFAHMQAREVTSHGHYAALMRRRKKLQTMNSTAVLK